MDLDLSFSEPQIVRLHFGAFTLHVTVWDDVLVAQWVCGACTWLVEVGEA